jgi:hypothetical protein
MPNKNKFGGANLHLNTDALPNKHNNLLYRIIPPQTKNEKRRSMLRYLFTLPLRQGVRYYSAPWPSPCAEMEHKSSRQLQPSRCSGDSITCAWCNVSCMCYLCEVCGAMCQMVQSTTSQRRALHLRMLHRTTARYSYSYWSSD